MIERSRFETAVWLPTVLVTPRRAIAGAVAIARPLGYRLLGYAEESVPCAAAISLGVRAIGTRNVKTR